MMHLDDEDLVLFSLGEATPDAAAREHLLTCSRCEAELVALTRVAGIGRTLRDVELDTAPSSVWEGIHSELGLSPELGDVPQDRERPPVDGQTRPEHSGRSMKRVGRARRPVRRRALTGLIAAAALVIGLLAGTAGTLLLLRPDEPRLLAEAELEPFPDWPASGSARVEEDASGERRIVVDMSAPSGGLREVWLLDPETSGLISLGLLSGETGTFLIPADIDLVRYSVIDVSEEPDDGDPAHSGDSIVRGDLRST